MYLSDLHLPSPQGRSEYDISARQIIDRAMAPFRADVADEKAAAGSAAVDSQEATFVCTTEWGLAVWDSAHPSGQTAACGHGYGFGFADLGPYLQRAAFC